MDGVALEGHGGRSYLPAAKRLAPLTKGLCLQNAQIKGQLVEGPCQPRQSIEHQPVLFARVGLCGHRKGLQAKLRHHLGLELHGCSSRLCPGPRQPIQQLGVGGRSAGGTFEALAPQRLANALKFAQVDQQVMAILGQAITEGRRLGGLQVGEPHASMIGPVFDQTCQMSQYGPEFPAQEVQGLAQAERVGVILNIHTGTAEVDDTPAQRALLRKSLHLGHEVMLDLGLDL